MAVIRAGSPPSAGSHLARPVPASSRTGSPNTSSVSPGRSGWASRSSAIRSAIQRSRSRAKAAASDSRRGDGAVATISRRVRSSRNETRRARRFTFKVTGVPATSSRSPSVKPRPKGLMPSYLGGFSLLWEGSVGRFCEIKFGAPDHVADLGVDLLAEPLAVEHAVVADARLDIVLLEGLGEAGAERVRRLGLADAGDVVELALDG